MKGTEEEKMASIEEYHLRTRCLQLSGNNDPVYGLISPYYAISHDQVPLELADSNGSTVHTKGCPYVYDAIGKDSDVKRFCTLNLFGAMWNREDGLNIPMPHLVFEGAFCPGSEWHDQEEVSLWDDRVVVLFQKNAWVDAATHMFGLKMVCSCFIQILSSCYWHSSESINTGLGPHQCPSGKHWDEGGNV